MVTSEDIAHDPTSERWRAEAMRRVLVARTDDGEIVYSIVGHMVVRMVRRRIFDGPLSRRPTICIADDILAQLGPDRAAALAEDLLAAARAEQERAAGVQS